MHENIRVPMTPPPPPRKSQIAIGFFRNTGIDPLRKAIGREVRTALCEIH